MTNTKVKPEAKANPKVVPEVKAVAKAKPQPEADVAPEVEVKAISKTVSQSDTDIAPKPKIKAISKPEIGAEAKSKTSSNTNPQLVKRVHEFYEELGREEVQAVNDMELAAQKGNVSK